MCRRMKSPTALPAPLGSAVLPRPCLALPTGRRSPTPSTLRHFRCVAFQPEFLQKSAKFAEETTVGFFRPSRPLRAWERWASRCSGGGRNRLKTEVDGTNGQGGGDGGQAPPRLQTGSHRDGIQRAFFFSRWADFFSAGVFCGFFRVCFLAFCDLAMVGVGLVEFCGGGERAARPACLLFLIAGGLGLGRLLAVMSAFFLWFAPSVFDCFCEACFCTDFGDRSPMVWFLSLGWLIPGMFVSPGRAPVVADTGGKSEREKF